MIGPIRRGMVRRHANTDTRFSIDNQPLLPRAASGHTHDPDDSYPQAGAARRVDTQSGRAGGGHPGKVRGLPSTWSDLWQTAKWLVTDVWGDRTFDARNGGGVRARNHPTRKNSKNPGGGHRDHRRRAGLRLLRQPGHAGSGLRRQHRVAPRIWPHQQLPRPGRVATALSRHRHHLPGPERRGVRHRPRHAHRRDALADGPVGQCRLGHADRHLGG